jgi:hypothetical protein
MQMGRSSFLKTVAVTVAHPYPWGGVKATASVAVITD